MDDTAQNSQQAPVQPVSQTNTQPVGQSVPPVAVPSQPVSVSITPGKEQAPISVDSVEPNIAPVETLPEISVEVKEAGVEARDDKETLDLKLEDRKAGFSAENEATPIATAPTNMVQFPISEDEARTTSKGDTGKSITWLRAEILRQIKVMHQKLFSQKP